MTASKSSEPQLRRDMGFWDVLLFNISAIVGPRWIAVAAMIGASSISLWVLATVLFFLPTALIIIELSTRYPYEGGLYVWCKEAFGDFHGFVAGWSYWVYTFFYFPGLLITSTYMAVYIVGPQYADFGKYSQYFLEISLALLTVAVFLNIVGVNVGKWLQNVGGVCSYSALLMLVGVAIYLYLGPRQASATNFSSLFHWNSETLHSWPLIPFAFIGLELACSMSGEIREPRKTLPRAIYASAALIAGVYIAGTIALLFLQPANPANLSKDVPQATDIFKAISTSSAKLGIIAAILITVGNAGGMGALVTGVARVPFVAGIDHYLPSFFGKLHPRWKTPYISILIQASISAVILVIFWTTPAYQFLMSMAVILYFVPFLYMYVAAIKLAYRPDREAGGQAVLVPGGKIGVWIAGLLGLLTTLGSIALTLILPPDVNNAPVFVQIIKLLFWTAVFVGTGFAFYYQLTIRCLRFFFPKLQTISNQEFEDNQLYRTLLWFGNAALFLCIVGFWGVTYQLLERLFPIISPKSPWLGLAPYLVLCALGILFLKMTSSALRSAQDQAEIEAAARGSVETDEEQQRDRLRQQQDQEALFRRNLKDVFVLQYFSLQGVRFFDDFQYQLQPRINVLLGKNGYGKTILLRNIAAMIQNDLKYSSQLFDLRKADAEPQLILEVTRNSKTARTVRNIFSFREKLGKIPLLAIPDSRFLNRSQTIVQASATGHILLAESGARHFLSQEPYEDVVEQFLSQLGIEYYMERRKGFRQPIFELIESAVRELTDDQEFAFCKIERIGQTGFEIWVRTTTSPGEPLPIHYASQGTLSVIAIIGLIYSFLRSLDPEGPEDLVMGKPGIVIIDEIDAHLHPAWQRKIIGLLCDRFPNVQFLVSAHSPVIVAECEWGEISVLRRNNISHCFYIETLERDFIGATYRELYDLIFEIDDIDEKYIHDAIKLATVTEEEREHEISLLDKKGQLSVDEERRINRLERETLLIRRAAEVRRHKMEDEQSRIEELEAEIRRLRDLQGKNPRSDPNG